MRARCWVGEWPSAVAALPYGALRRRAGWSALLTSHIQKSLGRAIQMGPLRSHRLDSVGPDSGRARGVRFQQSAFPVQAVRGSVQTPFKWKHARGKQG